MAYSGFLIAPFGTGLDTDKEIWQLPQDAFSVIQNGHIHHGNVEKRSGYSFYGYMVHNPIFSINGATGANPCVISTVAAHTYLAGDVALLTDITGMTELNNRVFTVANPGANSFELLGEDSTNYTAYSGPSGRSAIYDGSRMMGILPYVDSSGTTETLVFDTKRAAIYDGTNLQFNPLDTADIFSDDSTAYVVGTGWQATDGTSRLYFTNGQPWQAGPLDGIRYYDSSISSTQTTLFRPDLNTSGSITLDGAKLIFALKQRLLVFHTFENGVRKPQRLRWCAAQNPSNWDDVVAGGGGFVDAPTNDHIITAQALQDSIVVYFTSSIWIVRPVADPALPFRWDKLNDFRAASSRTGSVGYDRHIVSFGLRGIIGCDGVESKRIDERIQDFVDDEVNIEQIGKVFGIRDFNDERTWILYPQTEASDCNAALIIDDDSSAFSKYKFSREVASVVADMNVLGYASSAKDLVAADFITANGKDWVAGDAGERDTALSYFMSLDNETLIGGDRNGVLYEMNVGVNDDGNSIEFILNSAGWNPFISEGSESQFGYIDFYVSADMDTILDVEFFKNDNSNSYISQKLNLLPNLNVIGYVADITINSDPTTGFVIATPNHGVSVGDKFYLYGTKGAKYVENVELTAASVTADTISVTFDLSGFGISISGITQANPGNVTALGHGFSDAEPVYIVDVSGMTEVNNVVFTANNVDIDFFELQGVDTTGYTAYTTGGYAFSAYTGGGILTERPFYRKNVWKRAYAGGIGYVHNIRITESGSKSAWKILAMRPWFRKVGRRTHE